MVRILLLFVLLISITAARGQHKATEEEGSATAVWKPVSPEKLQSGELMILPSNRFLRLNLNEDLGFTKVIIQDLNGITLIENPFDASRDIDISILKPGNYLIKVVSANKVLQGKFGKRRF